MQINQQHFDLTQHTNGKIYRAGMIIYELEDSSNIYKSCKMLFMFPSDTTYSGEYYQIPKGRIESGETAEECAVREAKEEVGLFMGNVIDGPHEVGVFMGRTTLFICKVKPDSLFGEPSMETEKTKWLTIDEFENEGRPLHVPVVQAAYRKIVDAEYQR